MNAEEMEPKSSYLTSNWLVGVLIVALGAVGVMYFSSIQSTQAQTNASVQNSLISQQNQITVIQTQLTKQTAILILLAEHDGIPSNEIANLTQ